MECRAVGDDQQVSTPSTQIELIPVTSLLQASRIAGRWAATFSRLRKCWSPLGWLSFPAAWWRNMLLLGACAGDVVQNGVAAAQIPNPPVRPPRRLWSVLVTAAATFAAVLLVIWAASHSGTAQLVVLVVAALGAIATLVDELWAGWVRRRGGRLKDTKAQLSQSLAGPLVIGAMFGAWPRRTGAGGELLDAALSELAAAKVSMLVLARDKKLAGKYVERGGIRVNPEHPLHIAWINS